MPQNERPNILLVTTDQQRWDTAGDAAPDFMRTPHFDHLQREGITFSRAYADCPICVASRVSIMTGRTILSHGHRGNGPSTNVMGREGTLPTCLRELGYQTAAVGKMHFGPQRARHGFDEMILPSDYYREMRRAGHDVQPMRHGLGQNELYAAQATVPESLTLTSWIAEQCRLYIRERRDPTAPFFLWCSFSKPHPPLDPPEPYYSMYREADIPEPVFGDWSENERCPEAFERFRQRWSLDLLPPEIIRSARAAYLGLITQIDYNMGRVFAALQDKGLFEDTLVLYTSDHGEYLGDHRAGAKIFFHEPSAHVPFVVRLPKSWQDRRHGTSVDAPVTLADVLPTLVGAAGGQSPEAADGQDLIALAREQLPEPRQYVASAGLRETPNHLSITDGRWKYCYYPEGAAEQLFDLEEDPRELRDLAPVNAFDDERRRMQRALVERLEQYGCEWVEDGELIALPVREESERDRRNDPWPGYHTDEYEADIRH
jgi:arylsulfatase A-like enzyme